MAAAPDVAGLVDLVEIGRGGFGVVYRALELDLDRPVAVKVMFGQLDDAARRRFERERRAMGKISGHPHVVTVFRTGMTDSGQPFIVMELMEGGSMRDRVRTDGPVAWVEAVGIGMDIASALEEAHRAGIRHRDIKPGNLLVSSRGVVKLADFGIALIKGGPETQSSVVTASLAHAAPEVLAGRRPDERADIYSLGSTLYELLRGHPAFVRDGEESLVPLLARIARDAVPSLADAGVPDSVREVVERAMAKDPADRPASAADLREQLWRARAAANGSRDTTQRTALLAPGALAPPPVAPRPIAPETPGAAPGGRSLRTRIVAGLLAVGTVAVLVVIGYLAERRGSPQSGPVAGRSASADREVAGGASELLEPAGSGLDGGATPLSGPDYDQYVTVGDDDGIVSLEVPAAWSEVDTGSGQVTASEQLNGFYYSYTASGASVSVPRLAETAPDETLDQSQESGCATVERSDYDDGVFAGRFDTWIGCGADGATVVVRLAAVPHDGSDIMVVVSLQLTEERDYMASQRILNTITVNGDSL